MKFITRIVFLPFALVALSSLTAGCTKVGPDFRPPPVSVLHNWLETSDERVKTEPANYCAWWETFDDKGLNSVIERAYHENLSLKIAAVKVLEARAQLGIAVGNFYPQTQQLNGSMQFNRFSTDSSSVAFLGSFGAISGAGAKPSFSSSYWQDQVNLNVAWELDFWGKFRRGIESADATLRSSVANYDSALVTLTADAANSFIQIRTIEKRLQIARENLKTQSESLRIAEARYEGGSTSERDVEQAKTIFFSTQGAIPVLEAQLRQNKDALSVLLGMPPDELEDFLSSSSGIPVPPPYVAVGIPANLLRRRPDVRSANSRQ